MGNSINNRFSALIEGLYKGNKRAFAQAVGVSPTVVENVVGARQGKPSYDVISKVCANANVSPGWLLTGNGSMLRSYEPTGEVEILQTKSTKNAYKENVGKDVGEYVGERKVQKTPTTIVSLSKDDQTRIAEAHPSEDGIPLIPLSAVAGFCNGDPAVQVMRYECEKYVVPGFREADFLIPVKGDSMEPKYLSGDVVACKCLSLDTFFQWNRAYVVDSEQGVLIKRVKKGPDDDHVTMVSENEHYDPFVLHRSKIRALALVIGVIRME